MLKSLQSVFQVYATGRKKLEIKCTSMFVGYLLKYVKTDWCLLLLLNKKKTVIVFVPSDQPYDRPVPLL